MRKVLVTLSRYLAGYDSAVNSLELYVVRDDGSFQRLKDVLFKSYGRPKFSSTFFKVKDIELSGNKLKLEGAVMQESFGGFGSSCNELDRVTEERTIGEDYVGLESIL